MGLFSFPGKKKQDAVSSESEFYSRAEEESSTVRKRTKRKKTEESNDPVLPEKKRARRRLVGAVALVLAAVIGLPMILDSEPKPLASDIAIEIPSKDKVKPMENMARSSVATAGAAPTDSLDKGEEIIDPPVKETVAQNAVPPVTTPKTAKPESERTEAKPEAKSEPLPELRAVPKKAEKPSEEERAKALLEGKTDKSKVANDAKGGKFSVQVAALASQDKVNELQNKLKGAGIKSYTSKVATQSGERIRIRVGPFSSKEEADKMRSRLVKIGLGGTLVPA
jgi:DedD protein